MSMHHKHLIVFHVLNKIWGLLTVDDKEELVFVDEWLKSLGRMIRNSVETVRRT